MIAKRFFSWFFVFFLFCFVLFCFVLFCFVLFCFVFASTKRRRNNNNTNNTNIKQININSPNPWTFVGVSFVWHFFSPPFFSTYNNIACGSTLSFRENDKQSSFCRNSTFYITSLWVESMYEETELHSGSSLHETPIGSRAGVDRTFWITIAFTLNYIVGSGVLSLPHAVAGAGFLYFLQSLFFFLCCHDLTNFNEIVGIALGVLFLFLVYCVSLITAGWMVEITARWGFLFCLS